MNNELLKILSGSNKDIDNQKLMDYLSDKLSRDEKHDLERLMAESGLVNDAIEGLEQFKNKQNLAPFVDQLNKGLHKQLQKKIKRKQKRKLNDQPWLYLSVVIILLLIILGYIIVKKHLDTVKRVQHSSVFIKHTKKSPANRGLLIYRGVI